jgi:hypothetical protein
LSPSQLADLALSQANADALKAQQSAAIGTPTTTTTYSATGTLPPNGVWTSVPRQADGGMSTIDKPYVMSSNLQFSSIDPEWAIDASAVVEQTIAATLGMDLSKEIVKVTKISALNVFATGGTQLAGSNALTTGKLASTGSSSARTLLRNLSPLLGSREDGSKKPPLLLSSSSKNKKKSKRRQLGSSSRGVRIDFVVGIENKDRMTMMSGNMERLAEGDPTMQQVFSSTLDKKLVVTGFAPINLPANDIAFGPVRFQATTPPPSTSPNSEDELPSSSTGATSAGSNSQQTSQSGEETAEKSFFSTSNPVFLALFGVVVVAAGLLFSRVMSMRSTSMKEGETLPGGPRRSSNESSGNTSSTASRRREKKERKKQRRSSRDKNGEEDGDGGEKKRKHRRSSRDKINDNDEKYRKKVSPRDEEEDAFQDASTDLEAMKAKIRADFSPRNSPEQSQDLSHSRVELSPVVSPQPSHVRGAASSNNVEMSLARSEMSEKVISLKQAAAENNSSSSSDSSDSD